MKKKSLILIILVGILFFTGCTSEINKYNWNQAYSVGIVNYPYGNYVVNLSTVLRVTSEEDYVNKSGSTYNYADIQKLKKIYVKFGNNKCYLKLITWGGTEEIKEYAREEIIYIDYI